MINPAFIFTAGISILFVQNICHCETHLSKNTPSNHSGTKLKPLSIKTVIDCEIPAEHWKDSSESSAEKSKSVTQEQQPLPEDYILAQLFDFTTLYEDAANFKLLNELFSPQPKVATSKTEAYMEIAEHLNMKFVSKGYRRVKGYEQKLSSGVERKVSDITRFDVKIKSDIFRLKLTSSIKINEFQMIDLSAGKDGHSAVYKVQIPIDRLGYFLTSANMNLLSLPLNAIGATENWTP